MASNDTHLIAERYARALFALARQQDALDGVESDAKALLPLVSAGELRDFIENPLLPRALKAKALEAVLSRGGAQELTRRFIGVLAENNRLEALPAIIRRFQEMLLEERGEAVVEAVSATALSDAQYRGLSDALAKSTGRKVRLNARIDESLLGGLVLKIGGKMLDYSLASRLERLRLALKAAA